MASPASGRPCPGRGLHYRELRMTEISIAVQGVGSASVAAERIDDWRRRFAPAGSTTHEQLWLTSDGRTRSRKPSERVWAEALAGLASGGITVLEWAPARDESQFPIDAAFSSTEGPMVGRVAFNGVVASAPRHGGDLQADILEWGTGTVAALESGIGWADGIGEMLNRFGRAEVDREGAFTDAWWAMWIDGHALQRLGGPEAVVSGWPCNGAEKLSSAGRDVVLTMTADSPEVVEHPRYLQAFRFLRPVLIDGLEPRIDPAELDELFQQFAHGALPGNPLDHVGTGPTDEEIRRAPMPPADDELYATFKAEDEDERGDLRGPLIVSHPERGVLWESPEWMGESQARALAGQRRWRYSRDA